MREKIEEKNNYIPSVCPECSYMAQINVPKIDKAEVRELEARLGEAVELLKDWNTSLSNVLKKQELDLPVYDLFNMRYCLTEQFLTTLDQEKEKSDGVMKCERCGGAGNHMGVGLASDYVCPDCNGTGEKPESLYDCNKCQNKDRILMGEDLCGKCIMRGGDEHNYIENPDPPEERQDERIRFNFGYIVDLREFANELQDGEIIDGFHQTVSEIENNIKAILSKVEAGFKSRDEEVERLEKIINDFFLIEKNNAKEITALKEERQTLRAQIEEMKGILDDVFGIAETAPELNMGNYDHDDVQVINDSMTVIYNMIDNWKRRSE